MIDAENTLREFLDYLSKDDAKLEGTYRYLTKTVQEDCKLISGKRPEGIIYSLHFQMSKCSNLKLVEQFSNNAMVIDFKVSYRLPVGGEVKKIKFKVRLIKEEACRKPSENGIWGVNPFSIKFINK